MAEMKELPFKPDFTGRTAVVTGGAGVLCSEFCRALARCGARVAILNRTESKAEALAEEIQRDGGAALAVQVDVTDAESVERAHRAVREAYGPCELLINGAGGNHPSATTDEERCGESAEGKSFFDVPPAAFEAVFGLNLTGTLLPTQAFGRDMAEQGRGSILNISSMGAYRPLTKIPAYAAAKAGVSNFTEWLATYFAPKGVRVNAIAPGFFSTAQNARLLWNEDGSPTARTGKILAATPMGRFGKPEELVGGVLYLLDERSSGFVTGVVLPIDGGFNAFSGV